jgi:hypothetical protein
MPVLSTIFDFNSLTKRYRGFDRIQIARSSDIRQQMFSRDFYIGPTLQFPDYTPGTEPFVIDLAAGDFDNIDAQHNFKLTQGLINQDSSLSLSIETSRTQADVLTWYNTYIRGVRFAYQITDSCGQTSAYNPVKIELTSQQSIGSGLNKINLTLSRSTIIRFDEPNLDTFITAVVCNDAQITSPSPGYSIAATYDITEDLFTDEFSDEFD